MREIIFYAVLVLLCLVALKDPFKGILSYTFINIIRPEMLFWGGNTGAVAFKALFLCTVMSFFARGHRLFAPSRCYEVWCILWFYVAIVVSIWLSEWSPHPRAYYHSIEILKLFIYCWIIVAVVERWEQLKKFENLYLAAFTLLALWGWEQHFAGNSRLEGLGGKAFPDCNGLAAIFVLALPMAYSKLLAATQRRTKLLALASTLAMAMVIVFTQSRGGFLGLAVCVVLCFLHSGRKFKFVAIAAAIFFAVSPLIHEAYVERISGIAEEDLAEKDGSAGSRLVLWSAGLLMFRDHPLFGHGFMTFSRAKAPYQMELSGSFPDRLLEYAFRPYKVCHGTYFNILAEGGLFLAIPYFLLILGFLWRFYRNRSRLMANPATREQFLLLQGIAIGVMSHCVSILTIDAQMDIFMPIQLVCGGILLRLLLEEQGDALPEQAGRLRDVRAQEGVI